MGIEITKLGNSSYENVINPKDSKPLDQKSLEGKKSCILQEGNNYYRITVRGTTDKNSLSKIVDAIKNTDGDLGDKSTKKEIMKNYQKNLSIKSTIKQYPVVHAILKKMGKGLEGEYKAPNQQPLDVPGRSKSLPSEYDDEDLFHRFTKEGKNEELSEGSSIEMGDERPDFPEESKTDQPGPSGARRPAPQRSLNPAQSSTSSASNVSGRQDIELVNVLPPAEPKVRSGQVQHSRDLFLSNGAVNRSVVKRPDECKTCPELLNLAHQTQNESEKRKIFTYLFTQMGDTLGFLGGRIEKNSHVPGAKSVKEATTTELINAYGQVNAETGLLGVFDAVKENKPGQYGVNANCGIYSDDTLFYGVRQNGYQIASPVLKDRLSSPDPEERKQAAEQLVEIFNVLAQEYHQDPLKSSRFHGATMSSAHADNTANLDKTEFTMYLNRLFSATGNGCGGAMRGVVDALELADLNLTPEERLQLLAEISVRDCYSTHSNPIGFLGGSAASLLALNAVENMPLGKWGEIVHKEFSPDGANRKVAESILNFSQYIAVDNEGKLRKYADGSFVYVDRNKRSDYVPKDHKKEVGVEAPRINYTLNDVQRFIDEDKALANHDMEVCEKSWEHAMRVFVRRDGKLNLKEFPDNVKGRDHLNQQCARVSTDTTHAVVRDYPWDNLARGKVSKIRKALPQNEVGASGLCWPGKSGNDAPIIAYTSLLYAVNDLYKNKGQKFNANEIRPSDIKEILQNSSIETRKEFLNGLVLRGCLHVGDSDSTGTILLGLIGAMGLGEYLIPEEGLNGLTEAMETPMFVTFNAPATV